MASASAFAAFCAFSLSSASSSSFCFFLCATLRRWCHRRCRHQPSTAPRAVVRSTSHPTPPLRAPLCAVVEGRCQPMATVIRPSRCRARSWRSLRRHAAPCPADMASHHGQKPSNATAVCPFECYCSGGGACWWVEGRERGGGRGVVWCGVCVCCCCVVVVLLLFVVESRSLVIIMTLARFLEASDSIPSSKPMVPILEPAAAPSDRRECSPRTATVTRSGRHRAGSASEPASDP